MFGLFSLWLIHHSTSYNSVITLQIRIVNILNNSEQDQADLETPMLIIMTKLRGPMKGVFPTLETALFLKMTLDTEAKIKLTLDIQNSTWIFVSGCVFNWNSKYLRSAFDILTPHHGPYKWLQASQRNSLQSYWILCS